MWYALLIGEDGSEKEISPDFDSSEKVIRWARNMVAKGLYKKYQIFKR